jgi:hypothetical protein
MMPWTPQTVGRAAPAIGPPTRSLPQVAANRVAMRGWQVLQRAPRASQPGIPHPPSQSGWRVTGSPRSLRKSGGFLFRPPLTLFPCISVAMLRPMELDSYWRTLTVGGREGRRLRASTIDLPFMWSNCRCALAVVDRSEGHNPPHISWNIPLKCQRCRKHDPRSSA